MHTTKFPLVFISGIIVAFLLVVPANAYHLYNHPPHERSDLGAPATPTGVAIVNVSGTGKYEEATLTWNKVTGADGYITYVVSIITSEGNREISRAYAVVLGNDVCTGNSCSYRAPCHNIPTNAEGYCKWRVSAAKGTIEEDGYIRIFRPTLESAASTAVVTPEAKITPEEFSVSPPPPVDAPAHPEVTQPGPPGGISRTKTVPLNRVKRFTVGGLKIVLELNYINGKEVGGSIAKEGFDEEFDVVFFAIKKGKTRSFDLDEDGADDVKLKVVKVKGQKVKVKITELK